LASAPVVGVCVDPGFATPSPDEPPHPETITPREKAASTANNLDLMW
jgi:hypothetical protein